MTPRISLLIALTALAAPLALAPAAATAQSLSIVPKIGGFSPLSDLGELNGQTQELDGSLAIGLAAEIGLGMPFDVRANLDYATDTELSREGLGDPGTASGNLLAATADLVFRSRRGRLLTPYLLAGGGWKFYDVSGDELRDPDVDRMFDENENRLTGHVGVGVDISVIFVSLVAELSDYISTFEVDSSSELQHDLFAMLGVRVKIF